MKKIALTLIAVSALGLAACSKSTSNNTSNEANSSGPAVEDTNGALNDANTSGADANGTAPVAPVEAAPANDSAANGVVANDTTTK